jgi:RNA polymerase sigma-70 factor (ECF subfamily)
MSEELEAETMRRFEQAVVNLPRMQRDIFLAKCRDGRTYAESAARTRMTRKSVQKQLARALGNTRRQLDGERLRGWPRCFCGPKPGRGAGSPRTGWTGKISTRL